MTNSFMERTGMSFINKVRIKLEELGHELEDSMYGDYRSLKCRKCGWEIINIEIIGKHSSTWSTWYCEESWYVLIIRGEMIEVPEGIHISCVDIQVKDILE